MTMPAEVESKKTMHLTTKKMRKVGVKYETLGSMHVSGKLPPTLPQT